MIRLLGYTSTSKCFEKALQFAVEGFESQNDGASDQVFPVLLEIDFYAQIGIFEMDRGDGFSFSAFPGEEEVLV